VHRAALERSPHELEREGPVPLLNKWSVSGVRAWFDECMACSVRGLGNATMRDGDHHTHAWLC